MSYTWIWSILRQTYAAWSAHEAPRLGAALALYSMLSLAPLSVLAVAIVAIAFGHSSAQDDIIAEVQDLIGKDGGSAVRSMLEHAQQPAPSAFAAIGGVLTLLFGASGVFAELREALNKIWEVKAAEGFGVWSTVRGRLFSFGMVLAVGFLLLISLFVSAGLAAAGKFTAALLPLPESVLSVFNFLISLGGVALLFALIFKFVPQRPIAWRDVGVGAVATALLFTIGKHVIGLYLGKAAVASAYGAAGSLVVVIVWVYYSSMIFLFGAEFTRVLQTDRTVRQE